MQKNFLKYFAPIFENSHLSLDFSGSDTATAYTFLYKLSIFDPLPENGLSFSIKSPPKNCLEID